MHFFLLAIILLAACGADKREMPKLRVTHIREVRELWADYKALIPLISDRDGFIYTNRCDSLLFSSLTSMGGLPLNIEAAEAEPGRWVRRPLSYPECYASGGSKSSISQDMLLGLVYWSWRHERSDILKRIWDYCEAHRVLSRCKMGEGAASRVWMAPALQAMIAQALFKLTGTDIEIRNLRAPSVVVMTGYQAHLQVVGILMRGELYGDILESEFDTLRQQAEREPTNPLFQVAYHKFLDGNYDEALRLIASQYPKARLPNIHDWCSEWKLERDSSDRGWLPCPEEQFREHVGGEVGFLLSVME